MGAGLSNQEEEKRQYYKSWVSYRIPVRPVDPINFSDTESLVAFYLGYHDKKGFLKRFVKYLIESEDLGEVALSKEMPPNSILYYEAPPPGTDWKRFVLDKELKYLETENLASYIKAEVSRSIRFLKLQRIERIIVFTDEYEYWPNGKLKHRVLTKRDGTVVESSYDEMGSEMLVQES